MPVYREKLSHEVAFLQELPLIEHVSVILSPESPDEGQLAAGTGEGLLQLVPVQLKLDYVVDSLQAHRLLDQVKLLEAGEEDEEREARGGPGGAQVLKHLDSGLDRHLDVADDKIRLF